MIKFSVVQDVRSKVCIDLSLSIPSIWSVYLGFFRALEGIYLYPKKPHETPKSWQKTSYVFL